MAKIRSKSEDIRRFILENVESNSLTISKLTADNFGITRQAVNKHLQRLASEHALSVSGRTRNRAYRLASVLVWSKKYQMSTGLAEDLVWTSDIKATLGQMPDNVLDIWHYGFTEMFNNALDHSAGSEIWVHISRTALTTRMVLSDDGVGIFKKIQKAMDLLDARHTILELSKGKLTTDPNRHTGEGIFFTSRMFDSFNILSGGVYFHHKFGEQEDWILESESFATGTAVLMELNNHTARRTKKIFDSYTGGDDFGFNKTVVPVSLAQYVDSDLISRSQAKRLLARVELFKIVLLDFHEVKTIGRAFADEIFRVFAKNHPEIELISVNSNSEIKRIIKHAESVVSLPEK